MTREEQIRQIESLIECGKAHKSVMLGASDIEALTEVIKALQTQRTGKWIPVSERLPEENGDYFVTLENGVVTILGYSTTQRTTYPKGFYYISNGFSWRQTINPVIAWMPLPYKYTGENADEKS